MQRGEPGMYPGKKRTCRKQEVVQQCPRGRTVCLCSRGRKRQAQRTAEAEESCSEREAGAVKEAAAVQRGALWQAEAYEASMR